MPWEETTRPGRSTCDPARRMPVMKVLVAYDSRKGTTRAVADRIGLELAVENTARMRYRDHAARVQAGHAQF